MIRMKVGFLVLLAPGFLVLLAPGFLVVAQDPPAVAITEWQVPWPNTRPRDPYQEFEVGSESR